jgi:hypothetical protein
MARFKETASSEFTFFEHTAIFKTREHSFGLKNSDFYFSFYIN